MRLWGARTLGFFSAGRNSTTVKRMQGILHERRLVDERERGFCTMLIEESCSARGVLLPRESSVSYNVQLQQNKTPVNFMLLALFDLLEIKM
jgi:hypothetical protein